MANFSQDCLRDLKEIQALLNQAAAAGSRGVFAPEKAEIYKNNINRVAEAISRIENGDSPELNNIEMPSN